ncbi:MAG: hypothetical protein ACTSU5_07885 [Promethearchaeota archaeon]
MRLERQMAVLQLFDGLQNENFDYALESQLLDKYEEELIKPLILNEIEVGEKWDELRMKPAFDKVLEVSKSLAAANGYNQSIRKRFNKVSLILMLAIFSGLIAFSFIPVLSAFSIYIMFPVLLVYCFLPRVLRDRMEKRWIMFKETNAEEFRRECADELAKIHEFVQFIINDTRDLLVDAELPLNMVRVPLTSNDYDNLVFLQEMVRQRRKFYLFEFAPPPGYEPPQVAGVTLPPSSTVRDEFGVVEVEDFGDKFEVKEFKLHYLPSVKHDLVNRMLDDSDFKESEAVEKFFGSVEGKPELKCQCGKPLKIEDGQICIWQGDEKFKFFFGTTVTCDCGRKTYLLSAKPKRVPDKLKPVFE